MSCMSRQQEGQREGGGRMRMRVVAIPYDSGHRGARMGAGPEAILGRGLAERLRAMGHEVSVEIVTAREGCATEVGTSVALYRDVALRLRATDDGPAFLPIILGGNCGSTLGALGAVNGDDVGLIWLDAHGDFNTPETSPSGFFD